MEQDERQNCPNLHTISKIELTHHLEGATHTSPLDPWARNILDYWVSPYKKNQLTLGELISKVSKKQLEMDLDTTVWFDFVQFHSNGTMHSYRGYYDHLALGYATNGKSMKILPFLDMIRESQGMGFSGWKGGSYVMNSNTLVWVANPEETGSTAVVDVINAGNRLVIETGMMG